MHDVDWVIGYLYMTGDEAVAADFDRSASISRGAQANIDEHAGPVHQSNQEYNEYAPKGV